MADLLFVAIIVAFFGVAMLLVRACDAIIGPDPMPAGEPPAREPASSTAETSATVEATR